MKIDKMKINGNTITNKVTIAVILLFAFALRFIGGPDWGLPFRYDPDEVFFIQPAIDMYRSKDFNPKWFGHPGSTIIYLNMVAYFLLSKFFIVFHDFKSAGLVVDYFKADPTILYFTLRSLQVAIGCAVVLMTYLVGRKLINQWVAVVSALMVSSIPLMIHFSQIVRTDMLAALLILLVIYWCLKIQNSNRLSNYVYASLAIAAAIATKYPAGLISLYLVWSHFMRIGRFQELWKLVAASILSFLFIFIFSPFMFLDYQLVIRDLILESNGYNIGAMSEGFLNNLEWYLKILTIDSIGIFGMLAFALGFVYSIIKKQYDILGLCLLSITFLMALSYQNIRWERWLVMSVPLFVLGASAGIYWFVDSWALKYRKSLRLILLIPLLAPIFSMAILQVQYRSTEDTRTQAFNWILENIPKGKNLLVEAYGPQLPSNEYVMSMIEGGVPVQRGQMPGYVMPAGSLGKLKNYDDLRKNSVDYLVVTSFYDRYKLNPTKHKVVLENYDHIFEKSILVKEFFPAAGENVHPFKANVSGGLPIRIYAVAND